MESVGSGWLRLLLVCASAVVVVLLVAGLVHDRRRGHDEVESSISRNMEGLARSLGEHVVRTVNSADVFLSVMASALSAPPTAGTDLASLVRLLREEGPPTTISRVAFVLDRDGRLRFEQNPRFARLDLSDTDYFRVHQQRADVGLYVSPPHRSRVTGRWIVVLSRRVNDAEGNFAGIVGRSLELDYFTAFYSKVAQERGGNVTLWAADGAHLIVRYPVDEALIGRDFPGELSRRIAAAEASGTFASRSPVDGVVRLVSFRALPELPLVVSVAVPRESYLAAWRADNWRYGGGAAVICVIIVLLTVLAVRALARHEVVARRFRDFAGAASDWFWETDTEQRFNIISERGREFLGESVVEAMRDQPRWEIGRILAEDRERLATLRAEHDAGREFRNVAFRVRTERGVRHVRVSGKPFFARDGRFLGYRGVGSDVTQETEREEALRNSRHLLQSIIDQLPARISLKGSDRRYVLVNRARALQFGCTPMEAVGKRLDEFAIDGLVPESMAALVRDNDDRDRRVLDGREPVLNVPEELVYDDGRVETWLSSKAPLFDARGKVTGVLSVAFDITALRRTEQELRSAREAAETANQTKSRFLANMSHELRTPLNAIMGFSDVMTSEVFGPVGNDRYREYLRDINDSGRHLLAIINDILDLAKVESGNLTLQEELVEIGEVVLACVRLVRERARNAGIRLETEVEPALPAFRVDEIRLKQIIINLLSNAVKFTPAGGVACVAARGDASGGVAILVRDTGIGMSEAELAIALEPFRQVDNSLTRAQGGTGLGLPLTRALVELHGGSLSFASRKGEGTTVTVHLPATRAERCVESAHAAVSSSVLAGH